MKPFNSTNFIKTLKKGYDSIPYVQGNLATKVMVSDAINSAGYDPSDVLSYLCSSAGLPSTLTDAEWKTVIDRSIKTGYSVADTLKGMSSLKKKLSYEEMFNTAAACCGKNPDLLKNEICMDVYGWDKAISALVKSMKDTKKEEKVETVAAKKEEKKTSKKVEKKSSIKSSGKDSRCKYVTLINVVTGEKKTWESMRACEKETGISHGRVSQLASAGSGSSKGWKYYKEEPKKEKKVVVRRTRKCPIIQFKIDKRGWKKELRTFNSISEASKVTGIGYSSIWKNANGIKGYNHTGDYSWKYAEAEA